MTSLLARVQGSGIEWDFGSILIAIIVILGCVGIALIAARVAGFTIPPWVWQIVAIVVVVFVAIVAIKFLLSL